MYIRAGGNIPSLFLLPDDCESIGDRFPKLHRPRNRRIYKPPLVLVSQGIGKGALPKVVYCDFPGLDSGIHTLEQIHNNTLHTYQKGLEAYAAVLADTLNEWAVQAKGTVRVSPVGSVDEQAGLAIVSLKQSKHPQPFKKDELPAGLTEVLARLQKTATQPAGWIICGG